MARRCKVVWTAPASEDLAEIAEWIAADNPGAAAKLVARVLHSADLLADFPDMGRRAPEDPSRTCRDVVVGPCRVFYLHAGGQVSVLHVYRSERNITPSMLQ